MADKVMKIALIFGGLYLGSIMAKRALGIKPTHYESSIYDISNELCNPLGNYFACVANLGNAIQGIDFNTFAKDATHNNLVYILRSSEKY